MLLIKGQKYWRYAPTYLRGNSLKRQQNKPVLIRITQQKTLVLNRTEPHIDECKRLIMEVLKQAVRDYYNLPENPTTEEVNIYEAAVDFLFEPEHIVNWGGRTCTTEDLLDILDLDIDWFRERILDGKIRSRKKSVEGE